jgi:hypothetical protein
MTDDMTPDDFSPDERIVVEPFIDDRFDTLGEELRYLARWFIPLWCAAVLLLSVYALNRPFTGTPTDRILSVALLVGFVALFVLFIVKVAFRWKFGDAVKTFVAIFVPVGSARTAIENDVLDEQEKNDEKPEPSTDETEE